MSTFDALKEIGQDLLLFANNPETALGFFEVLPPTGTSLVHDEVSTGMWVITRTRDETTADHTHYEWHRLKGRDQHVTHSLRVEHPGGWVRTMTLTCKIATDTYVVVYNVELDRIRTLELSHHVAQIEPKSLLRKLPSKLTPSSFRADLASV